MKKIFFILVLVFIFYSCADTDVGKQSCYTSQDCPIGKACYDGLCFEDYCKEHNISCGQGMCVAGTLENSEDYYSSNEYGDSYYCVCNSDAELAYIGLQYLCIKKGGSNSSCNTSNDCNPGYYCDFTKKCKSGCEINSDCNTGYYCDFNTCRKKECSSDRDCPSNKPSCRVNSDFKCW